MKRSRFSEEQIIAVLKEQEAGMATAAPGHVAIHANNQHEGTRLYL